MERLRTGRAQGLRAIVALDHRGVFVAFIAAGPEWKCVMRVCVWCVCVRTSATVRIFVMCVRVGVEDVLQGLQRLTDGGPLGRVDIQAGANEIPQAFCREDVRKKLNCLYSFNLHNLCSL